jgi:hypothetical protein
MGRSEGLISWREKCEVTDYELIDRMIVEAEAIESRPAGPGRPSLTDAELSASRDKLFEALDQHWPEIGWNLLHSSKPTHIAKSFSPLLLSGHEAILKPFLRPNSVQSTTKQIRHLRRVLSEANEKERIAGAKYENRRRELQTADAAVVECGSENRNNLKLEIARRSKTVLTLTKDYESKRRTVLEAQKLLRQAEKKAQITELAAAQNALRDATQFAERAAFILNDETKSLRGVRERLAVITPERSKVARKEASQRRESFDEALAMTTLSRTERERAQQDLLDHEAGFVQMELLKFMKSGRASHEPLSLANAMAGLPEIGCRVSFSRCQRLPSELKSGRRYRVFEFIASCCRKHSERRGKPFVTFVHSEIERLPKTIKLLDGKRAENPFRKYLVENWWALNEALIASLRSKVPWKQMPYAVAAGVFGKLANPQTDLDRLLIETRRARI